MVFLRKTCLALVVAAALAAASTGLFQGGESVAASVYSGDLIRFHVIANSDSPADQALKLKVRDEVISAMSPVLAGAKDINEARNLIDSNTDLIVRVSGEVLNKNGCTHPVKVTRGSYHFPEKTYSVKGGDNGEIRDLTLPAGGYEAVRVVIGSGKGANWWCVLFPPMCFVNPVETASDGGSGGEATLNPDEIPAFKYDRIRPEMAGASPAVEYRLKVVDWCRGFGGI